MSNRYFCLLILAAMVVLATATASAQVPQSALQDPQSDRFLQLVQPRLITEIERDIQSADQSQTAAGEAERMAQEQRSSAAARLEEQKKAIDANKDKKKMAKRENNSSELTVLNTEAEALERDKKMLEEREALRDAEIDLARKRNELATLTKQALDLERQLVLKRGDGTQRAVSGPESAKAARLLIDLEKATLEAQRKVADKQGEVADAAKKVIDRQLKTLQAQYNIYAGN